MSVREITVPARDLKVGDVVVVASSVFVVELVARHITEEGTLHVVLRSVLGGVLVLERGESEHIEALRGDHR